MTDLKTSNLVVYVSEFVRGSGGGGGSNDEDPLQCLAISGGSGSVAAAAWRTHFAVFVTPWDEVPISTLATFRCPPLSPSGAAAGGAAVSAPGRDLPACVQFVPGSPRALVYSSPLLLGRVIVFDYRLSTVIRSIGLPQVGFVVRGLREGDEKAWAGEGERIDPVSQ